MLYKKSKCVAGNVCARYSARLISSTAPTSPVAFLLHVDDDVHISALEELDCALSHVFEVCGVGGDDVDDAEDPLLSGSMVVFVVVVVVVVCMSVRVIVIMIVSGVLMLVSVCVAVVMVMVMAAVAAFMLVLFRMGLGMRGALVFKPELWHCVAYNPS